MLFSASRFEKGDYERYTFKKGNNVTKDFRCDFFSQNNNHVMPFLCDESQINQSAVFYYCIHFLYHTTILLITKSIIILSMNSLVSYLNYLCSQ